MLPIVHHPDYRIPLRRGHRFPMSKYGYLRDALVARGLLTSGRYLAPAPVGPRRAARVHAADYVARVIDANLSPAEVKRVGLPGTPEVSRRARLASAGTLLATWLAIEHGIAANSAGGSHHAGPDGGAGFCVFNDVAIAAAAVLDEDGPVPILVVDCDVHQGDGSARIFAGEPRVFTLSLHAARNYPSAKATSDCDVALPDGTDDHAYLAALAASLAEALAAIRPRLVYYNAGVDVWERDRIGRLGLTEAGIRARDAHVIAAVRATGAALVCVVGGGYDDDPARLAARHAVLFEEAAAWA